MTDTSRTSRPAPRGILARWGWPVGVIVILALSAGANIWVMFIAKGDAAFAVEPDYYAKAVAWDARMAQERVNASLAWRSTAQLTLATPGHAGRMVLELTDGARRPVAQATVSIEAMHNARASQRYEAVLVDEGAGRYSAPIDAHRPGVWEVRVTATRGTERFTQSLRVDVPAPGE